MRFENKVALVTGAAVGIGRETAIALAGEGAAVFVNYSNSADDAAQTCEEIRQLGGSAFPIRADVADEASVREMFSAIFERCAGLDILVNNAGITEFIPFADLDDATADIWDRLYRVNVEGAFFCAREAAKLMKGRAGASIINLSSQAGIRPFGSAIPYSVSKAGVIHLTECLAVTLAPDIRVNCVSPGAVENTRWNARRADFSPEKNRMENSRSIPLKRLGQPQDIVKAILFLADADTYCTGVNLPVDGGRILV